MSLTATETKTVGPRRSMNSIGRLPLSGSTNTSDMSSAKDNSLAQPTLRQTHGSSAAHEDVEMDILSSSTKTSAGPPIGSPSSPDPSSWFRMSNQDEWKYLAALCYCIFYVGWNDGTLGPLLPRIQEYYDVWLQDVNDRSIQLTRPVDQLHHFVPSFRGGMHSKYSYEPGMISQRMCHQGSISGAFLNVYLSDKLGFGKVCTFSLRESIPSDNFPVNYLGYVVYDTSSICSCLRASSAALGPLVTFSITAAALPFPVMCAAYFFTSMAMSLQVRE
jgi:hypothetical protein